MATDPTGLRARKKAKTRLAIADIATRLFIERGFDQVTVADVAAASEVSLATIFNYFETKEDLFFDREADLIASMCQVVTERGAGEAIVPAFHRAFRDAIDTVLPGLIERDVARFVATIEASPALRARAGLGLDKAEARLAAAIATDLHTRPDDLTPRVVAAVVVALERVLLGVLRTHLLRGSSAAVTRRALRRDCDRAFAIVDAGIGAYGARPRAS
ncbi:MAG TPA: helix-turn-helix domain-containing protein [Kofleriaceae bacterium]|jgi:AcrR family transcriptional regulator|nr:helix-turn-helix domain-containing protein [Kofleriaceae bacterium]